MLSATILGAPVSYNLGTSASAATNNVSADGETTGDFNGDGKLDLAVVHSADGTLNILLNNGAGTFAPAASYATGISNPIWVTAADLNGDKKLDLVVLGNSSIAVFMGNGNGTFQPAVTYASGPVSRGGVAVGDFNGDGKLDLAVAQFGAINSTQSAVDIFINNGNGTFKPYYTVGVPPAARSVAVGDFNHDGKADLAVADGLGINNQLDASHPAGVTILLGNGNGTFTTTAQYNAVPTPDPGDNGVGGGDTVNPENIYAVDLNNDGKIDLIETLYDHNIDVFLGNGNGTFAAGVGYTTGEYPRAVAVVDLNNDGKMDLVVGNVGAHSGDQGQTEDGSIAVLMGNGNGTFAAPIQYTPFGFPGWLVAGDFNGDGLADVAVTRVQDGHSVNIMFGEQVATSKPTVTAVTPAIGSTAGNQQVTITGTNFIGAVGVGFGSLGAISMTVNSATSITAVSPVEGPGTVNVVVTNASGASATSSTDRFTFTAPPTVTGMSPASGTSAGGTVVNLTGTNFSGATSVLFGTVSGTSLKVNSATSITITSPAESPATVDVSVITPGGASAAVTADHFTFVSSTVLPAPVALSPGSTKSPGPLLTTLTPTLSWQAITGVTFTGYQINLYDVTTGKFISDQVGISVHSLTISSTAVLAPGNTYAWNVRALNGTQSGPPSANLYFQTPTLPQPVILGVGNTVSPGAVITTLTPTLTWDAVTGVTFDSYQINLYDITTAKFLSIQVNPADTSYPIPAGVLTAGNSYVWNLRLKVGNTTGPESTTYLYFQAE